jgi:formate hydrogenlyase transcriptional activator
LQNAVERAVILARGGALALPLPSSGAPRVVAPDSWHDAEEILSEREWLELERANVLRALRQSRFRLHGTGGAAERLGLNPGTLASRLKKMGISAADLRRSSKHQSPQRLDARGPSGKAGR